MRYANITSIPSSYIVAFFSSLGDASPPGEIARPQVRTRRLLVRVRRLRTYYIYILFRILIDFSILHAPFKKINMVNCTLE